MKLSALLLGAFSLSTLAASAQTWSSDSVTMGAGYANDVFYSLKNSTVKTQDGSDWTLAFQMTTFGEPSFNASARVNHAKGNYIYPLHLQATLRYANLTAADTVGKTSATMQLLNVDTSWGTGALYQNRVPGDPFDFGWGEYAGTPTHDVNGKDSIYLLKTPTGAYKLWMQKYVSFPTDSISYTFRIAALDGTGDQVIKFYRKPGYTDRLFAYYKVGSSAITDREPSRAAWDIEFTQYAKLIPIGGGNVMFQAYTGVLGNERLQVADVRHVDVDNVSYTSYPRTQLINEIGDDWKVYTQATNTYNTTDSTTFFIKALSSTDYYQLQFTRFDGGGAGNGKVVFRKRALAATAVTGVAAQSVTAWHVSPNPASNAVNVMVDAKDMAADATMQVMDAAGKVVSQMATPLQKGMNAYGFSAANLPNGLYFIRLGNGAWGVTQRLVVAH